MDTIGVSLQDGTTGKFPGIKWPNQIVNGQPVDYEKCIYIFTNADAKNHAEANQMCRDSIITPQGLGVILQNAFIWVI